MRAWCLLVVLAVVTWMLPTQRAQAFSPVSGCQAQDATHFVCSSISAMSAQLDAMPDATGTCSQTTGDKQWHTVIFWNYPASGNVKVSGNKVQRCGFVPVPPSGYDFQIGLASSTSNCPTGSVFDEKGKTCVDRTACLARNADLPATNAIAVGGTTCKDGCEYGPIKPGVDVLIPGTTSQTLRSGQLGYTGNTCTSTSLPPTPIDPKAQKDACTPAGTFTFCLKPDGQHCYTASTGKQLCWKPGETGEKNADNTRQKRDPGTTTNPPTPLNNGDTLTKSGDSLTTNTTTGGRTITTNTTNYVTGTGSDSGPDDSNPDGNQGSASGGEGCDAPPVCSGDAVNCAILHQAWLDRCGGNNHKVGGKGTCGTDGAVQAYACSGDEILCEANLHALEQKCQAEATGNSLGTDDGLGDFDQTHTGEVQSISGQSFIDRLDSTGFLGGARTCVHFAPLDLGMFGTFDMETQPWLCDFQAFVRGILYLLGGAIALYLVIKGHG